MRIRREIGSWSTSFTRRKRRSRYLSGKLVAKRKNNILIYSNVDGKGGVENSLFPLGQRESSFVVDSRMIERVSLEFVSRNKLVISWNSTE